MPVCALQHCAWHTGHSFHRANKACCGKTCGVSGTHLPGIWSWNSPFFFFFQFCDLLETFRHITQPRNFSELPRGSKWFAAQIWFDKYRFTDIGTTDIGLMNKWFDAQITDLKAPEDRYGRSLVVGHRDPINVPVLKLWGCLWGSQSDLGVSTLPGEAARAALPPAQHAGQWNQEHPLEVMQHRAAFVSPSRGLIAA